MSERRQPSDTEFAGMLDQQHALVVQVIIVTLIYGACLGFVLGWVAACVVMRP